VLLLRKPTDDAVRAFLAAQRDAPFSYPEVGGTAGTPPRGYVVDHNRTRLGAGDDVYGAATAALRRWAMFDLGWVELRWPDAPIAVGATVAVLARFGAWWLNAARIVAVFDDPAPRRRFGFAYGTLEDHVEQGEERFSVEWDERDGSVWYDLLASPARGIPSSAPRTPWPAACSGGSPATRRAPCWRR
jgi:uncharacterized protein (UPF0548 family)